MRCKTCKRDKELNDNRLCNTCQMAADQAAQSRGRRPGQSMTVAAAAPADDGNGRGRGNPGPQPVNRQGLKNGKPR